MFGRLANLWDSVTSGLWFVPALMVLASALAAEGVVFLDRRSGLYGEQDVAFLFSGTAESARALLSMIAGALITVVSLVFSITFVALSQVSTQFTPRLLRNFMRDRVNQVVLGAFVGGFAYCVLVLRTVRSEDAGAAFVPPLAVTTAMLISLVCIALLVLFFHHVSRKLQIAVIMHQIHDELETEIDRLYPEELGQPSPPEQYELPDTQPELVKSTGRGFLRAIDERGLHSTLGKVDSIAHIAVYPGCYIARGDVLARVWPRSGSRQAGPESLDSVAIRRAFALGAERSVHQDVFFGLRQLVDVALRALSPGVNDPTTAEQALRHLGELVSVLANRAFPLRWRRVGASLLSVERPDFEAHLAEAFDQVIRAAADHPHVLLAVLSSLAAAGRRARDPARFAAVARRVERVMQKLATADFSADERAELERRGHAVLDQRSPAPRGVG